MDERKLNQRAKAYVRNCLGVTPKSDCKLYFVLLEAFKAGSRSILKDLIKDNETTD